VNLNSSQTRSARPVDKARRVRPGEDEIVSALRDRKIFYSFGNPDE
jgi:hypothetical protein